MYLSFVIFLINRHDGGVANALPCQGSSFGSAAASPARVELYFPFGNPEKGPQVFFLKLDTRMGLAPLLEIANHL